MKNVNLKFMIIGFVVILGIILNFNEKETSAYYGLDSNYIGEHNLCVNYDYAYEVSYYSSCLDGYKVNVQVYYSYYSRKYEFHVVFSEYSIYNQPYQGKYQFSGYKSYGYESNIVDIYMGNPNLNDPNNNIEIIKVQNSDLEDLYVGSVGLSRAIWQELCYYAYYG